jgi:hypothetical protein
MSFDDVWDIRASRALTPEALRLPALPPATPMQTVLRARRSSEMIVYFHETFKPTTLVSRPRHWAPALLWFRCGLLALALLVALTYSIVTAWLLASYIGCNDRPGIVLSEGRA